jgi:hypothetical protein
MMIKRLDPPPPRPINSSGTLIEIVDLAVDLIAGAHAKTIETVTETAGVEAVAGELLPIRAAAGRSAEEAIMIGMSAETEIATATAMVAMAAMETQTMAIDMGPPTPIATAHLIAMAHPTTLAVVTGTRVALEPTIPTGTTPLAALRHHRSLTLLRSDLPTLRLSRQSSSLVKKRRALPCEQSKTNALRDFQEPNLFPLPTITAVMKAILMTAVMVI